MQNHIETIRTSLEQIISGEPAPSFKSTGFADIIEAVNALSAPGRDAFMGRELLGLKVLHLLLESNQSSMQSERAMAIMRDKPKPL